MVGIVIRDNMLPLIKLYHRGYPKSTVKSGYDRAKILIILFD